MKNYLLLLLVLGSNGFASSEPTFVSQSAFTLLAAAIAAESDPVPDLDWAALKEESRDRYARREEIHTLDLEIDATGVGFSEDQRRRFYDRIEQVLGMASLNIESEPSLPKLLVKVTGTPQRYQYNNRLFYSGAEVDLELKYVGIDGTVIETRKVYVQDPPIHLSPHELEIRSKPNSLIYERIFTQGKASGANQLTQDLVAFVTAVVGPRRYAQMLFESNTRAMSQPRAAYFLREALDAPLCRVCWMRFRSHASAQAMINTLNAAPAPDYWPKGSGVYSELEDRITRRQQWIQSVGQSREDLQESIGALASGDIAPSTYERLRALSGEDLPDEKAAWARWWYRESAQPRSNGGYSIERESARRANIRAEIEDLRQQARFGDRGAQARLVRMYADGEITTGDDVDLSSPEATLSGYIDSLVTGRGTGVLERYLGGGFYVRKPTPIQAYDIINKTVIDENAVEASQAPLDAELGDIELQVEQIKEESKYTMSYWLRNVSGAWKIYAHTRWDDGVDLEEEAVAAASPNTVEVEGNRITSRGSLSGGSFETNAGDVIEVAILEGTVFAVDEMIGRSMQVDNGMSLEQFLARAAEHGIQPKILDKGLYQIGNSQFSVFAFRDGRLMGFVPLTNVEVAWSFAKRVNTSASYGEFLSAHEGSRYAEQALLRSLYLRSEENRGFVGAVSVSTLPGPQKIWGGLSLAESFSLDCVLTQCDEMFTSNEAIAVNPKKGYEFVQVEALIEVNGSLPRTFISHAIVALFDGVGTESMVHSWHEPVDEPNAAGWTTNMQSFTLKPEFSVRIRWLFVVDSESIQNLKLQLFDGEIQIQELPATYGSNDLEWAFPTQISRLSATF